MEKIVKQNYNNCKKKFFNRIRLLEIFIYFACMIVTITTLYYGLKEHLFPAPVAGMDQEAILSAAKELSNNGILPPVNFRYSYGYTAFLTVLNFLSNNNLIIIRVLQILICSLIPIVVFRCCRLLKLGKRAGLLSSLCYILYAPAILISIDFLRAAPLGLAFICSFYFWLLAYWNKSAKTLIFSGLFAALCVLGRENFIPVAFAPLLFFFYKEIRKKFGVKGFIYYILSLSIPLIAIILFNGIRLGSYQIVPGNVSNIMNFYHGESHNNFELILSMARSVPYQFVNYISNYEMPNSLSVYAHKELISFLRFLIMPFNVLCALGLVGACFNWKNKNIKLLVLLIVFYSSSLLFFTIFYRFRIPCIGLIAILTGAGISSIIKLFMHKNYIKLLISILFIISYVFFTNVNVDSKREFSELSSVARLLIDNNRFEEAESYLLKLSSLNYNVNAGYYLLARKLWEANDKKNSQRVLKYIKK